MVHWGPGVLLTMVMKKKYSRSVDDLWYTLENLSKIDSKAKKICNVYNL